MLNTKLGGPVQGLRIRNGDLLRLVLRPILLSTISPPLQTPPSKRLCKYHTVLGHGRLGLMKPIWQVHQFLPPLINLFRPQPRLARPRLVCQDGRVGAQRLLVGGIDLRVRPLVHTNPVSPASPSQMDLH